MRLFSPIALLSIAGISLFTAKMVSARPHLYLDTFTHGQSYQECIANAKKVLRDYGFDDLEEDEMPNRRVSEVTGYHKDEALTAAIECDQKLGTTSMAVSGLDSQVTYSMYKALYKAQW